MPTASKHPHESVADWAEMVRAEFFEAPSLVLTRDDIADLLSLDREACDDVVERLVDSGFLVEVSEGFFGRPDDRSGE